MRAIEIIENSKKTHEDWLAFFLRCPDEETKEEYKHLGDRFHHEKCISDYEKAIKGIEQLQADLDAANKKIERQKVICGYCEHWIITPNEIPTPPPYCEFTRRVATETGICTAWNYTCKNYKALEEVKK